MAWWLVAAAAALSAPRAAAVARAAPSGGTLRSNIPSFEEFIQLHGRTYQAGSEEYELRRRHFDLHVQRVVQQNSQPGRTWTATVNQLADRTDEERAALRGYKRVPELEHPAKLSLKSDESLLRTTREMPAEFGWKPVLKSLETVLDQDQCGACWAFSAASTLRAHSELYQQDRTFSTQELVSCTPDPKLCGGFGGCFGATAELAFQYVADNGCQTEEEQPYDGGNSQCKRSARHVSFVGAHGDGSSASGAQPMKAAGLIGYKRLQQNSAEAVLHALYQYGPLSVSISAPFLWDLYSGGVLPACSKDEWILIDHVVTLVGYGVLEGAKYWHILNSWGSWYGEKGYVKLQRRDAAEESRYCGMDPMPQFAGGCEGGHSLELVCGACGMLFHTVVPVFERAPEALWSRLDERYAHLRSANHSAELLARGAAGHRRASAVISSSAEVTGP